MHSLEPNTLFANKYLLVKQLGVGGFAAVWQAEDQTAKLMVAIKIYLRLDEQGIDIFREEYRMLFNINHSNLLKATYFDIWDGQPYLVMPFCSNGAALKMAGKIEEKDLAKLIMDIASGLNYLHSLEPPIIHHDIKPDNFLIDENGNFLLSDFGISQRMRRTLTKSVAISKNTVDMNQANQSGTAPAAYRAPELFSKNNEARIPIKANDIFSLGVSIYEMTCADMPFGDLGGLLLLQNAEIPDIPSRYSEGLNSLVSRCMAKDPWDRPTALEIKEEAKHYLQSGEWTKKQTVTPQVTNARGQVATVRDGKAARDKKEGKTGKNSSKKTAFYIGIPILLCIAAFIFWWFNRSTSFELDVNMVCPSQSAFTLEKISATDQGVFVWMKYVKPNPDAEWVIHTNKPEKNYRIVDAKTGKEYMITVTTRFKEPSDAWKMAAGETVRYYMGFPPLPKGVKKIHLIEGSIDFQGGHFININLRKNDIPDQYNNRKYSGWFKSIDKKYDEAISDLSSWINQNTTDHDAYFKRGSTYIATGRYQNAISDLENAIRLLNLQTETDKSRMRKTLYQLGLASATLGANEFDKAIQYCNWVLNAYSSQAVPQAIKTDYVSSYYLRGIAYYRKLDYTQAIADFSKYTESEPKAYMAYYWRAAARSNTGDNTGACADCRVIQQSGYPTLTRDANFTNLMNSVCNGQMQNSVNNAVSGQGANMTESQAIGSYLQQNGINAYPTSSGLYYIEQMRGTGIQPSKGEKVKVHYTGKLLNGTKFDSSYDRNEPLEFTFGVDRMIPGFEEGIGKMRTGGKALLIIPSAIGYGNRDMGKIPANSTLVFQIELINHQ